MCICACSITDPLVFANRRTDRDAANAALETFRRLLSAVIELRKNKELIVVVDHVDQLSGEPLTSLTTTLQVIQDMMILDWPLSFIMFSWVNRYERTKLLRDLLSLMTIQSIIISYREIHVVGFR